MTALPDPTSIDTLPVVELFSPTIQGEGPAAGRAAAFVRFAGCNLSCSWCMVPDMMILRPDFTWTPAGDLRVGDKVLGRTDPKLGKHGQLTESVVTHLTRRDAPLVRVNGNLVCAADTRFWTSKNRAVHSGWRNIERCVGLDCTFLAEPAKRDQAEYQLGYLAGMADGDGTFWTLRTGTHGRAYRRFRLALNDPDLLARVKSYAAALGYTLRDGTHNHTGYCGPADMACLWLTVDAEATRFEAALAATPDSESWAWGYLAGIFDAEGHLTAQGVMRIAQYQTINPATYERIAATAERLGFDIAREAKGIRLRGRGGELWRFLVNATPGKATSLAHGLGRSPNNARTIHSVEEAGHGEVVSMTTSTGNYIAEGWLVHNCDSPYTWDGGRFDLRAETTHRTAAELVAALRGGPPLVILTGGEPLLQQPRPAWTSLLTGIEYLGAQVHIETNGTVLPSAETTILASTIIVSPKLGNAGPHRGHQDAALHEGYRKLSRRSNIHLKVVVASVADIEDALLLGTEFGFPKDRIWVMPEGTTTEALQKRWPVVAETAAHLGINASHRLHVLAWGDERGR